MVKENKVQPTITRPFHQKILLALANFNANYLHQHQILFGGGTRICLELDEYRQSVDIDFLCPNSTSYRAVRSQVSNLTLGELVTTDFIYPKEIRIDRDAVRCFIDMDGTKIKLEFVACADYPLQADSRNPFFVPMLDHTSCFITKLLANADRYRDKPYKDMFDILAMLQAWGQIPERAWQATDEIYGRKAVMTGLQKSFEHILTNKNRYLATAVEELLIKKSVAETLLADENLNKFQYMLTYE